MNANGAPWAKTDPKRKLPVLNFGGQSAELWCEGGEARFVTQLIAESANFALSDVVVQHPGIKSVELAAIETALKKPACWKARWWKCPGPEAEPFRSLDLPDQERTADLAPALGALTPTCRSELAREKRQDTAFIGMAALSLTAFASKLAPYG